MHKSVCKIEHCVCLFTLPSLFLSAESSPLLLFPFPTVSARLGEKVLEEKGKGNEALQPVQTLWEREKEVRGKTLH